VLLQAKPKHACLPNTPATQPGPETRRLLGTKAISKAHPWLWPPTRHSFVHSPIRVDCLLCQDLRRTVRYPVGGLSGSTWWITDPSGPSSEDLACPDQRHSGPYIVRWWDNQRPNRERPRWPAGAAPTANKRGAMTVLLTATLNTLCRGLDARTTKTQDKRSELWTRARRGRSSPRPRQPSSHTP